MSSAYRESAAVTRVPLGEIAWRRRVAGGAEWLPVFLVLRAVFVVFLRYRALSPMEAFMALGLPVVGAAGATWMLTTPAPGSRVARLAWILRASIIADAVLQPLARYSHTLTLAIFVCGVVVDVTGLLYVARLFEAAEQPRRARMIRVLLGALVLAAVLRTVPAIRLVATIALVVFGIWCFVYLWRLRRMNIVTEHQWWLDDEAAAPGQWLSLLVFKDRHAEVMSVDGALGSFVSANKAYDWLEENGYVWGQSAVEAGLVAAEPPHVLPAKA